MECVDCGRPVEPVARALALKIVSPGATEFRCLGCLAKAFGSSVERLLAAARNYRFRGCVLFAGVEIPPAGVVAGAPRPPPSPRRNGWRGNETAMEPHA